MVSVDCASDPCAVRRKRSLSVTIRTFVCTAPTNEKEEMSGDANATSVAEWMAAQLEQSYHLFQETVARDIAVRFGKEFTYVDANGNLRLRKNVLAAFKKRTGNRLFGNAALGSGENVLATTARRNRRSGRGGCAAMTGEPRSAHVRSLRRRGQIAVMSSIIRRRRGLIAAIGFSCLRGGLAQPKSTQMGDLRRHSLHCRAAA
jgi:hypothetical protein